MAADITVSAMDLAPPEQESPAVSKRRARELYKYFVPPENRAASQSSAPDTTLAAQAQLVAWRLNTRRAMISLIDRDIQYFVAESSKTLNLEDSSQSDDPLDALWAGCVAVEKSGRLCEHTIKAQLPPNGAPVHFEVCDLAKDERFNELPFVSGDPHFRYYCGVPLRTKLGVNIGSLFALDDKVREPMTIKQLDFLATIASNCMSHLEALKDKDDMKRIKAMNTCLAAFVDPDHRVRWGKKPTIKRTELATSESSEVPRSQGDLRIKDRGGSRKVSHDAASVHSSTSTTATGRSKAGFTRAQEDEYMATFNLASSLLAKSLDIGGRSGVVVLDAGSSLHQVPQDDSSVPSSSDDDEDAPHRKEQVRRRSGTAATQMSYKSGVTSLHKSGHRASKDSSVLPSEVLSTSSDMSEIGPPISSSLEFKPLSQSSLAKLIKRHPRGMLFNIDDEEAVSSSSGEDLGHFYPLPKRKTTAPSEAEVSMLTEHFPSARQIIFVPVWNPSWSRFSGCFAINTSPFRDFRKSPEFLHTIAFCNCTTIELTRIATLAADQQKSDFIGSISHELRSPLHGILASCEFLDDTELSSFQKSLVDTADSCARTLLDTINMVLDYSKINAFERNMTKARTKRQQNFSTSHLQPALNISGDVDLAAITEEVVEGVATGQVFKDRLADVDSADLPAATSKGISVNKSGVVSTMPDIEIILDIPPANWMFLTQPGAFRRVVMNVFGNSLKYTTKGYIRVALQVAPAPSEFVSGDVEDVQIVTLTITDTGRGISAQYMKTKLFTPFAQESTIAPGTGLGLSLVRSIVRMLHGEIDIKSTINVGTEVTIKFPMITSGSSGNRSGPQSSSEGNSSGSIERAKDESLSIVAQRAKDKTALYYRPAESGPESEVGNLTQQAVGKYLTKWYNFNLMNPSKISRAPHVILVAQAHLAALREALPKRVIQSPTTNVVVISPSSNPRLNRDDQGFKNIETISYPFGPYKLAKAIRICLDNIDRAVALQTSSQQKADQESEEDEPRDKLTEVMQSIDQVTIGDTLKVVQQGQMMANEGFASLMMDAMSASSSRSIEQSSGFPFPAVTPGDALSSADKRPAPGRSGSEKSRPASPLVSHHSSPTPTPTHPRVRTPRKPKLLLVDDNKVNLRLLQTFMKKRGYTDVHTAEDGAQSVQAYRSMVSTDPPRPPDIIFMDISMPVMNGFEATRNIRELEGSMREALSPIETPASSMIIALTGLASSRDQSEAFTSGFDLYLVKPISFKSVAKLLDSWEKNGGAATVGVPHGPLSSEDTTLGTTSSSTKTRS